MLASAAGRICGCAVYTHGEHQWFSFVGTNANLEAAHYVHAKLNEQRTGAWLKYKRTGPDNFYKFCFGYARSVVDTVDALIRPMTALNAERERARLWFESHHEVGQGKHWGSASSTAGMTAGRNASFHRGEFGAGRQMLLR
jgi:hypothetical protein